MLQDTIQLLSPVDEDANQFKNATLWVTLFSPSARGSRVHHEHRRYRSQDENVSGIKKTASSNAMKVS